MKRRILLVGGDEFRPACAAMDAGILALAGRPQPRVAIIPTAAALENPGRAADNGIRHFAGLGADAYGVNIIRPADARDPALVAQIAGADVIYFTGGSPEHLLSVLAGSPLLDAVREANAAGAVWCGSSAGAMVLGQRMRRPAASGGVDALSVVPGIIVLPHHERSDPAAVAAQLAAQSDDAVGEPGIATRGITAMGLVALGIDGATGVLLDADGATVSGAGGVTVYRAGRWQRYAAGDSIPGLTVVGPGV